MPDRRPMGDQHALSETRLRPTCQMGDLLETNLPHRLPTCLIGYQHALLETHPRPTCMIGDLSETHMPDLRPIGDRHASSETDMHDQRPTLGKICISYGSPMRHDGH